MSQHKVGDWVYCPKGKGYQHDRKKVVSDREWRFPENSVGMVEGMGDERMTIWLIGDNAVWDVPAGEVKALDVTKTGDRLPEKICNICHCLLPVGNFDINRTDQSGRSVRRPTCQHCRTNIDKRPPKSGQAKKFEKTRPKTGEVFTCPICRKRTIVGVTAEIVADHDHHTGNIRDWLCESCNTGLGRFKNGQDCLKDAIAYLKRHEG